MGPCWGSGQVGTDQGSSLALRLTTLRVSPEGVTPHLHWPSTSLIVPPLASPCFNLFFRKHNQVYVLGVITA